MPAVSVDVIYVSPRVNAKLNQRHGLTILDVEDACDHVLDARWSKNDRGVDRLLLIAQAPGRRRLKIALFPVAGEAGAWNLGTAFPVQ